MTGDREKALAAGCDDYVSKPINHGHLFSRVEYWIAKGRDARRSNTPLKAQAGSSVADPSLPSAEPPPADLHDSP